MADPIIVVTDTPDRQPIEAIASGLDSFNDEVTGINDRLPLIVFAKDPVCGDLIRGVAGRTSLGLLFDVFYIARNHRGLGLGRRILQSAEEEGRRRGCRAGVLCTISFQAPGFYQRHDWRIFGEVSYDPPGTSRIFMTKEL
ncbi:GNAT family N-acetyltransferase [Agrobacterium rhizogenes]|uniref:GNAT family N-acetyltransferase n=1 Tax=Rhizobium rhizogenes TaxID=359 RepID=UPI00080FD89E|nr:GNAT family N-acetyltransferase [Rhizobium rhizogenes]OCJ22508.1 GCN5 family acetyltransferase [Agrobacterium sp. B131/95]OCJ28537.1 GCN5 family acetyltransferase [Agrobacterium sp. B133/95]NTI53034.1 GNAT family N-acetyltransferase [Rhizobium rhizogenes]NTI98407.1 GNAT family N-acetyltransferase [Rhizobium rhizogenes]